MLTSSHPTQPATAKPSLLLISGWAHGIDSVQPMADALADRFAVNIRTGAHVLHERRIPETDIIVTGSMGGLLALELLPPTCRRLVLISSTARFCATDHYPCGTAERIVRRMAAQLPRDPGTVLDDFFRNVHAPRRESRHAAARRHAEIPAVDALVAGLEYLRTADLRARIPTLDLPVLLLHGTEDRIIPFAAAEWLHERLPNSVLKRFDGEGHALPAHQFARVMKAIQDFLDEGREQT